MDKKYKLAILSNEIEDDHKLWVKACEDFSELIEFKVINLTKSNWLERISEYNFDYYLAKPPGLTARFKQLYDERIYLIENYLKLPLYPSANEIFIYENKRFFYSWLRINNLPHPATKIFYNQSEAMDFICNSQFPLVAKNNIGASGSGVKILKNNHEAADYVNRSFSEMGAFRKSYPKIFKGNLLRRINYYWKNPEEIKTRKAKYQAIRSDRQIGYVILQEFIPHSFEWRVVVIGDSYFAHKKLKSGEKASGSLLKNYDNPPLYLFDFVKPIMQNNNFYSQAIDIFEPRKGELLINEMQCIFGQSDPYQMLVDGTPGRYRFINGNWVFEKGDFNLNESYNLRIRHILDLLKRKSN